MIEDRNRDGVTALIIAVKNQNIDMVALLIKNGADVNAKDPEGLTALKYGQDISKVDVKTAIITLLKENSAKDFI